MVSEQVVQRRSIGETEIGLIRSLLSKNPDWHRTRLKRNSRNSSKPPSSDGYLQKSKRRRYILPYPGVYLNGQEKFKKCIRGNLPCNERETLYSCS